VDAIHTCSFCSVSCFSKAERVSRASPLRDNDDGAFDDDRLVTGAEFNDDGTREEAADRAVAPFAIEDEGGVGEADRGRLGVGDGRTFAIFCGDTFGE
jgi:hypothetical protein